MVFVPVLLDIMTGTVDAIELPAFYYGSLLLAADLSYYRTSSVVPAEAILRDGPIIKRRTQVHFPGPP